MTGTALGQAGLRTTVNATGVNRIRGRSVVGSSGVHAVRRATVRNDTDRTDEVDRLPVPREPGGNSMIRRNPSWNYDPEPTPLAKCRSDFPERTG